MAYADPPYFGCCALYGHRHDSGCWDDVATHAVLIAELSATYPDGWALSCSTPSLRTLLPLCPDGSRVAAWVKPFAVFKPNVNPAYAWEPVIFRGGRKRSRCHATVRDWVDCNITLKRGFTGAKPDGFCFWMFALLGAEAGDDFTDVFPGSGAVTAAWSRYQRQAPLSMIASTGGDVQEAMSFDVTP
jgi:hypothetical protein